MSITHAYTVTQWDSTSFQCNDYKYAISNVIHLCDKLIVCAYDNSSIVGGQIGGYCANGGCQVVKVTNNGELYIYGNGQWHLTTLGAPYTCSINGCNYFFKCSGATNCDFTGGLIYYFTTPPLYSRCTTPTLNIVNSYPSTIMSDRYRLNFTFSGTSGWSGITCTLALNGVNYYSVVFSTDGVIDISYSSYPKEFTIAQVTCTYNNEYNNTTTFASQQFLLDSTRTYKIYDAQKNIGRASIEPDYLTIGTALTKLKFYVLSEDKEDYDKDLLGTLTVNVDPATLNCINVSNLTEYDIPIIQHQYLKTLAGLPPYEFIFPSNLTWVCNAPTSIPVTLAVKDFNSGANVATANFNIIWVSGVLIVDNVNLIKNTNTSNLELWASVSNIFTHEPIFPTAYLANTSFTNLTDIFNLSCSYSMTSQNYTTFTGTMGVYYTNRTSSDGLMTIPIQTDAYNTTVDPNSSFDYGNKFDIQINCSANNYTFTTIATTRWVSTKRIKTFACYIGTSSIQDHTIYYAHPYITESYVLNCFVTLDTEINSDTDLLLNYWLQHSTSQFITLYQNYLSNDVNSPCPELKVLPIAPVYVNNKKVGFTAGLAPSATGLYATTSSCVLTSITSGLIKNNLVQFNSGDEYNLTTGYYYPTTTAVLAFNLSSITGPSLTNPIFSILNNKTTNKGIITEGDILSCSNIVTDPNYDINSITYSIYETSKGQSCIFSQPAGYDEFNTTRTYSNILTVSKSSCPFFTGLNKNGLMRCTATVYYSGQPAPKNFYSNTIPYKTASTTGGITLGNTTLFNLTCTSDIWDLLKPNCPYFITTNPISFFLAQARDEPEIFVLEFFLLIMGLFIVAILIIPIAKLIISLRQHREV